jgi:RNA polymerase sigma-70 factor (ECF subfamily)
MRAASDFPGSTERAVPTFEDFFESNRRALFGAMCLVSGNRAEAEEVTQDAFLKVWERWDRVGAIDDPTACLFRVAMNQFRNRVRRARVAARKTFAPDLARDDLAAIEDRDEVVRWLRVLPARQRAAVVLTTYLDYSSEDAARLLGIQASTVRALASQGRAGIRHAMEERP